MRKRVVITGIGVVAPNAIGVAEFKNALIKGISGIKYIKELEQYNFACCVGGVPNINNFKENELFEKHELTHCDINIKYSLMAAIEAWEMANLQIPEYNGNTINNDMGAIVGSTFGGIETISSKLIPFTESGQIKKLGSQIIENWMPNGPAAAISKIFALGNQVFSNSTACATGTDAIIMAYERIKNNQANIMLAGGSEPFSPYSWAGFDSMRLLTRAFNDNPEQASRPMSDSSSGFVPSAGAGILIIEELSHATKRGANIIAEIIGGTMSCGGHRNGGSMTAYNKAQAKNCIKDTITKAKIKIEDIDLISGHLTGTKADIDEIKIWSETVLTKNKTPYINAPKSILGHLFGAAGAVESIAAVLQLKHSFIHGTSNCKTINTNITNIYPSQYIPKKSIININLNYIIKASFGFGDVNSCVIFKKFK